MKKNKKRLVMELVKGRPTTNKILWIIPVIFFLLGGSQVFSYEFEELQYGAIFNEAVSSDESRHVLISGNVRHAEDMIAVALKKSGYTELLYRESKQNIQVVAQPQGPFQQMLSDRQHARTLIIKCTYQDTETRVDFVNGSIHTTFEKKVNEDITEIFQLLLAIEKASQE